MSERKYEIGRVIGKGSFGTVYIVRHNDSGTSLALGKGKRALHAPVAETDSLRDAQVPSM